MLTALCLAACVPQVGPRLDGGDVGGAAGGSPGGNAGGSGGAQGGSGGAGGGGGTGGGAQASCSNGVLDGDETAVDCGGSCVPCADGSTCLSPLDCQSGVCAGVTCGPPGPSCGAFAGCTSFVDLTAPAANRTVSFGGAHVYNPKCIKVRFGQQVTFVGSLGTHPLLQACGPVTALLQAQSGSSFTVTMDQALGVFGYYCNVHGSSTGSGMAGAIEVVR
jgi:plastocyanin